MKLLLEDEFFKNTKPSDGYWYFDKLSVFDERFKELIRALDNGYEDELISVLNSINNQGITSIQLQGGSYTVDGNIELGLSAMATSELFFLAAFIADKMHIHIYVQYYIQQLTKKTCITFFKLFGNSEYVDLVLDEGQFDFYKWVYEEAMA